MESLADAVGLRTVGFGACVLNVVDGEIELVIVALLSSTVLGSPIGENPQQFHTIALEHRQHSIIEQVSRGNRRLAGVELARDHLAVGIDEGFLIDSSDTLDGAAVVRVLGPR